MKEILLTQGKIALVDDVNYEWINQWDWYAIAGKSGIWYAARMPKKGEYKRGKRKPVFMHRVIMGTAKGDLVDHLDGDGLRNLKQNMRNTTKRGNMQNLHSAYTSLYPGVSWSKAMHKWTASCDGGNKPKVIGYYEREIDAAIAYRGRCALIDRKSTLKELMRRRNKPSLMQKGASNAQDDYSPSNPDANRPLYGQN